METRKVITQEQQGLINAIESTPINLGEVEIHNHPLVLIPHTRSLRIIQMVVNLKDTLYPRTDIYYCQILRDLEGNIIPNNLPSPQWTIYPDETSTIRDQQNERIMFPLERTIMETVLVDEGLETEREEEQYVLDEQGNQTWELTGEEEVYLIGSHKYLLFLQHNKLVGLMDLLEDYMQEKVTIEPEFRKQLDSL